MIAVTAVNTTGVFTGDTRGNFSGSLYRITDDFASVKRMYLPPNTCTLITDHHPSGQNYGNRHYMLGGHTANLLIDEEFRALRQGIMAPNTIPVVTVGAGAHAQVFYTRYYDELTNERSPLSGGFALTGDLNRTWTLLPTEVPSEQITMEGLATIVAGAVTCPNLLQPTNFGDLRPGDKIARAADLTRWGVVRTVTDSYHATIDDLTIACVAEALVCKPVSRVSHVELWVSVDGSLPRFIMRVRLGTTTVTESTATLALGEAEIDSFVEMPYGEINVIYNDRQIVAGVDGHRDSVFLSEIAFPERHAGLIFRTKYNEPIVGMFRYRDYVVVLCPDSSYRLQGYTEDDYVMTVLEPKIGGLGHWGNAVTDTYAIVPGRKGFQVFNGSFHQGIAKRRIEWQDDYLHKRAAVEIGFAVVNPNDETYQFYEDPRRLGLEAGVEYRFNTSVWIGHYDTIGPEAGGALTSPEWLNDTHRTPSGGYVTFAAYITSSGEKIGKLFRGDTLGNIYQEDDTGTVAYDGDAVIVTSHVLFGDPGGGVGEGKKLVRLWSYVQSEESAWQVRLWAGDERAYPPDTVGGGTGGGVFNTIRDIIASYKDDVAASLLVYTSPLGPLTAQPQTVHVHPMAEGPTDGRGFTFEYTFHNPLNVEFIGLGGEWGVGEPRRPGAQVMPAS